MALTTCVAAAAENNSAKCCRGNCSESLGFRVV
jgi:hypothetical protein